MWLIICYLIGLPKFLLHFLLSFTVLIVYLYHKIVENACPVVSVAKQYERFRSYTSSGQLSDKCKSVLMKGTGVLRDQRVQQQQQRRHLQEVDFNPHSGGNKSQSNANRFHLASVAVALTLVAVYAARLPMEVQCLEQDAEILKPVAGLAKSIIRTVTLGEPLEINFDPTGLAKNFAYFTWRTGFPVSMPRGLMQKVQDFYNRVKLRVDSAEVSNVERKSLAKLKVDLDEIVDGIVEEVRSSSDGLYTDYLKTRVNGIPLEDACTKVGVQLKAYKVDLTNYRDIAGAVLGVPMMPTVASTMMGVASLAKKDTVQSLGSSTGAFLSQLPASALGSVSSVSNTALNSIGQLGSRMPMHQLGQPTLFASRQPQDVQA